MPRPGAELLFDAAASVPWDADRIGLFFNREVDGIPVERHRFQVYVVRGQAGSFGAGRWGPTPALPKAVYGRETTRMLLHDHMGILPGEAVEEIESGTVVLTPVPPEGVEAGAWNGAAGGGVAYRLVHRFVLRVPGEPGTWVGKVDAATGDVVAFYDDEKYAQAKGWVYPVAADGLCEAGGCIETDYPMPYANLTVDGAPGTTNDVGFFDCSGGTASTALQGPYVRINDNCGAVNEMISALEEEQRVREALLGIPERCRRLLTLLYFTAPTPDYDEVSRRMKMPRGSLGPTRARCLDKLKERLGGIQEPGESS